MTNNVIVRTDFRFKERDNKRDKGTNALWVEI